MPIVTVCPTPNGLPIANTTSPTRRCCELPTVIAGDWFVRFYYCQICIWIGSRNFRCECITIGKDHADFVGSLNHMMIGKNEAAVADNDAGSQAGLASFFRLRGKTITEKR